LLYSLVILLLYNGDSDALSILDELRICYDKVIRHKKTGENDADPTGVLIEILLSFISKPSVLLRKLAQQVFCAFAGNINANSLQLLFNVGAPDVSPFRQANIKPGTRIERESCGPTGAI
jgi:DNA polymerase phi